MKIQITLALLSTAIFSGCYPPTSIDSGEAGVVKAWGEVQDSPIAAGLTDRPVTYKQLEIQRLQAEKWDGSTPSTLVGGDAPVMLMAK
jgi:hypothetical protein